MSATFRVQTFGCKLNQFDSAAVELALRSRGLLPATGDGGATVVVVNTCTVTHRADADARRALRRLRRANPGSIVVAMGCLAEREPGLLAALPEVDLVVGRAGRARLGELVAAEASERGHGILEPPGGLPACAAAPSFGERTRAFLKVQEGCDLRCAYCVIPQVRGPSTSVPPEAVEAQLRALVNAGYREVVLTGVNTGDYGRDLSPPTDLPALLRRLLRVPGLGRLRLNSLEPRTVTPEIVALLAGEERLAPHLQIPLQSGSDRVLAAMRRNYRAADYARVVDGLRRRVPRIGLGADVIAGHPGEGAPEFGQTLRFLASSALSYLHVFSYSPRPGTAAAAHPHPVDAATVRQRSRRLRELGEALTRRFRESFVGQELEVLGLDERRPDGRLRGLSGNFLEVALEAGDEAVNRLLRVTAQGVEGDALLARPPGPINAGSAGT